MARRNSIICDQCGTEAPSREPLDGTWLEVGALSSFGSPSLLKRKPHAEVCSMACVAAWAAAADAQPALP